MINVILFPWENLKLLRQFRSTRQENKSVFWAFSIVFFDKNKPIKEKSQ